MPWVLVVEAESRNAERIRDALRADGWEVEVVPNCQAAQGALARSPQLVIANVELEGAQALLRKASRGVGGSGSIALIPELLDPSSYPKDADEHLIRPFTEQEVRQAARRLATAGRANLKATAETVDPQSILSSKDLFGDLLAEVEQAGEVAPAGGASKPAPAPGPPAEAPKKEPAPRPVTATASRSREDTDVEQLLSRTLSGLETPKRISRPTPAPPATPPPAPEKPAPSAPRPEAAEPAGEKRPPAPTSPEQAPPVAPSSGPSPAERAERISGEIRPGLGKRPSREIDLSELDKLAGAKRAKESAAGSSFATQRLSIPPTMLGKSPPTEFGQYTLLERIAVGGMAEVWKARMKGVEGFQKTVAIKRILPHLTDSSDFVTMFIDEAKLAAQLNHNHIIHIYDLGKIGDDYFIAMEYVDGKDLRTILNTAREKEQPLPLGLALLVASRLASALEHAHSRKDFDGKPLGLVHRDVSPQNVLISFEGDIKLCDFGIVKAVTKASKTQMGALKGKLQYMSPEQAWGRPVDARSDIFSLGALLFEMLTGRRLFSGDSEMSVLDAVREGRIQAPRDLDPRIPLEVNALVLKALARDPEDRFETAGQLQQELDALLASLKPTPSTTDLGRYMRRLFGEVRAETESAAPAPAAAAVPSAVPAAPVRPAMPSLAPAAGAEVSQVVPAARKSNQALLWIGLAALLALAVGGFFYLDRSAPTAPAPSPPAAQEVTAPDAGAAEPISPPEESAAAPPQEAVQEPVTAPASVVAAAPEPPARAAATPAPVEPTRAAPEAPAPRPQPPGTAETRPAAPPAPEPAAEPPAPAPTPSAAPEPAPAPTPAPAPPVVAPAPAPATAPVTPAVPPPSVREGDLVAPGPGVKPPTLVSFRKPEYPPIARRLKVEGTVVLSLLVDENGKVIDVRVERGVAQNVGINEAAIEAARSARFDPGTKQGVRVKMWYTLTIPFKL